MKYTILLTDGQNVQCNGYLSHSFEPVKDKLNTHFLYHQESDMNMQQVKEDKSKPMCIIPVSSVFAILINKS